MKVWQRKAIMAVYAVLDSVPAGFGGSASTTPLALMNAGRVRAAVVPQCQRVLEALAFGDPRDAVESEVDDMKRALADITNKVDSSVEAFEAMRRRGGSTGEAGDRGK